MRAASRDSAYCENNQQLIRIPPTALDKRLYSRIQLLFVQAGSAGVDVNREITVVQLRLFAQQVNDCEVVDGRLGSG